MDIFGGDISAPLRCYARRRPTDDGHGTQGEETGAAGNGKLEAVADGGVVRQSSTQRQRDCAPTHSAADRAVQQVEQGSR